MKKKSKRIFLNQESKIQHGIENAPEYLPFDWYYLTEKEKEVWLYNHAPNFDYKGIR